MKLKPLKIGLSVELDSETANAYRRMLTELANATDAKLVKRFCRHWPAVSAEIGTCFHPEFNYGEYPDDLPKELHSLFTFTNVLRAAWTGSEEALVIMQAAMLSPVGPLVQDAYNGA